MMTPKRKSIPKITERALRKCTQFYQDAVHAYCTPAEFLALCWYFNAKPRELEYYIDKVKNGDSTRSTHYIHVNKWKRVFPVDKYASLECRMCQPL